MIDMDPILLALLIPAVGAMAIGIAGRINDNLRETMTLGTAGAMPQTL